MPPELWAWQAVFPDPAAGSALRARRKKEDLATRLKERDSEQPEKVPESQRRRGLLVHSGGRGRCWQGDGG